MHIDAKIERSKSSEKIDFTKIDCLHTAEPLVAVANTPRILVRPIWTVPGDFEGRLYAEYRAVHPEYNAVYVRQGLHERLIAAAGLLPDGLKLVVHAGHRPPTVQRHLLRSCRDDYKRAHPEVSDTEALEHARIFVSDPDIKLPPHCCGAAVDVQLFDVREGAYVDFGSKVNLDDDISHLHSGRVNATQKAYRMQLLEIMLEAGFASYYAEWWHFSYGDEIWAWFYGKKACLYDVVDTLDVEKPD